MENAAHPKRAPYPSPHMGSVKLPPLGTGSRRTKHRHPNTTATLNPKAQTLNLNGRHPNTNSTPNPEAPNPPQKPLNLEA